MWSLKNFKDREFTPSKTLSIGIHFYINISKFSGILVTSKETEAFEEKINNAIELLNEQKRVYEDEEKALRVLREEEVEDFEQKEKEKRKKRKQKRKSAEL